MQSLVEPKYGVPLDLALSFLTWRELVPASAVCSALLAESRPLGCGTWGPLGALPTSDGALRWLARRAARSVGGGLEFLKISDTACRHTDAGALAVSSVCETLRVLHFHSKVARACEPRLTPRALQALLGHGRPALSRAVLHGDAVTDAALEILGAGCPRLRALWLSCSAHVSGAVLRKVVSSATCLEDLRLDSLLKVSGSDFVHAIAAQPLRCFLVADAPEFPTLLSAVEVGRWQAMRRLGILFEAGCPAAMVGFRSLEADAALALGSLPMLEALAVANVHVGDALLQSFWQRHVQLAPATSRSVLRSLSLEGAHGATLQGIWNLVRALGRGMDLQCGELDELQLTASPECPIDDHALEKIVGCGIRFLTLEGANISKAGICRCVGLQALRSKSCAKLDLPPKPRLGPAAGRREVSRRGGTKESANGIPGMGTGASDLLPDVRLLGPDQQLCYWWNKGYKYDDLSWYGLEHVTA
ncbi:unnamed protein product [Symbiodinium natans]|uniref:Uncharacterized protein n=1 Tax=Symbiodinium natans TaxID=878477 RepID=A0A812U7S0_9DINO|nr:unnamed protein product [Symbiodinium natans]